MPGPISTHDAATKMRKGHVRHLIVEMDGLRIVSMRDLMIEYLDEEGPEHLASLTEMYRMFGSSFRSENSGL